MKTIKFRSDFIESILNRGKTTTWRLFDDKDFQIGDEVEFINWESKEKFAEAMITDMQIKLVKELAEEELLAHGYLTLEEMIKSHNEYYDNKVNFNTEVKLLSFKLLNKTLS